MTKEVRNVLALILTSALTIALLAWSLSRMNLSELGTAIRNARWCYLPFAVIAGLAVFPIKAFRWRIILAPIKKVSFRSLLSATMIGFMVNCIFSRIGELVRAVVLKIKKETQTSTALASIALERIFDMFSVVLFLVVALLWLKPTQTADGAESLAKLRVTGALVGIAMVVGIAFLALLKLRPHMATRLVHMLTFWLPKHLQAHVAKFLDSFLTGLNAIRSVREVVVVSVLSIFHWLVQVLMFYLVGQCFPTLNLTFPAAMTVSAVTALGVAAAPLPLYLGIFQAGVSTAALILAVPQETATTWGYYGWVTWAANIPPVILVGFIFLWAEGLSLRDLRQEAPQNK